MKRIFLIYVLLISPLHAETIELPDIEILGREPSQSVLQHETNQIPVSVEEVISQPGVGDDPLKAIDNLPGMSQANGGVYMHGSSTTDNQILVDGLSLPYLFHFGDTLSLVSKDVLSAYDVYPSGFGAQYANRLGGVIDIKLRAPQKIAEPHRLHIGTYDASYFVEGALSDKDTAYFGVRKSYIDLFLTGLETDDIDFTQFPKFTDMIARWDHQLEKGGIQTNFIASTDELVLNLKDGAVKEDKALLGRFENSQSFYSLGANYWSNINDDLSQETHLTHTSTDGSIKIGQQTASDPNPGQPYSVDVNGQETELKSIFKWFMSEDSDLEYGLSFSQGTTTVTGYISLPPNERDSPSKTVTEADKFTLDESVSYDSMSFFISHTKLWNDQFSSSIGIRSLMFNLYDTSHTAPLSPRLSGSFQVNNELKLTASYGVYYQTAQGYELSKSIGNPNLDFQRAEHRTLGAHYQFSDDWSAQFALYHKPMTDLVVDTNDSLLFNNNGSGDARGFDLFIKRRPVNRKQDWVSYTFAESNRTNHNTGLSRPFDGDQTHRLTWVHQQAMTGSWKAWQWGFKLKAHTGQPYTKVISREAKTLDNTVNCNGSGDTANCYWSPIYENQNASRLPDYFNIDLSMNKTVKTLSKHYDLKFELLNIGDLIYANVDSYDYGDDYQFINKPKTVRAGFGLLPSVSVTFYF